MSYLDTTVTNAVTLGVGGNSSPFTISAQGEVSIASGAAAVLAPKHIIDPFVANAGQVIDSGGTGIEFINPGTLENRGLVKGGTKGDGAQLGGGSVYNGATGVITGGIYGVYGTGNLVAINNLGSISGTASAGYGVYLQGGGELTNSGAVTGKADGVYILVSATHWNSGFISGGKDGVRLAPASASVSNAGTILGGTDFAGLRLAGGGVVANLAGGLIIGGTYRVHVTGSLAGVHRQ